MTQADSYVSGSKRTIIPVLLAIVGPVLGDEGGRAIQKRIEDRDSNSRRVGTVGARARTMLGTRRRRKNRNVGSAFDSTSACFTDSFELLYDRFRE